MTEKIRIWDPIIIKRPPRPFPCFIMCYYPAPWEILINPETSVLKELVAREPLPTKADMTKYFNARINIAKRLIEEKKLDPKIGEMAIKHFEAHLNELKGIS